MFSRKFIRLTVMMIAFIILAIIGNSVAEIPDIAAFEKNMKDKNDQTVLTGKIESIIIKRPHAEFHLGKGRVTLFDFGASKPCAMVYEGDGIFMYDPPDATEREQLIKFTGRERLKGGFESLVLFFTCEIDDFPDTSDFLREKAPGKAWDKLSDKIDDAFDHMGINIVNELLGDLLSGSPPGYFHADFKLKSIGHLIAREKSFSEDSFTLIKLEKYSNIKSFDVINAHPFGENGLFAENNAPIDIISYDLDSRIESSGKMLVKCRIGFRSKAENCRFIYFKWNGKNSVISAADSNGDSLHIVSKRYRLNLIKKNRGEAGFGVVLNYSPEINKDDYINIVYECNLLNNTYGVYFVNVDAKSYPRGIVLEPENYNFMFDWPDDYRFVWLERFLPIRLDDESYFVQNHISLIEGERLKSQIRAIPTIYDEMLEDSRFLDEFTEIDSKYGYHQRALYGGTPRYDLLRNFSDQYNGIYYDVKPAWYPEPEFNDPAVFRMRFDYPDDYQVVSCGNSTGDNSNGKTISIWEVNEPTCDIAFNIGSFYTKLISSEIGPQIIVYSGKRFPHTEWALLSAEYGLLSASDMSEQVGFVLSNSLMFFTSILGPCPYDTIRVAPTGYTGHAYSSPGLINLPWDKYQYDDFDGVCEQFIAHQVAHQWWGEIIDVNNYRDEWVLEGLADYCGFWYYEMSSKNGEAYRKMLKDMRTIIVSGTGMESWGTNAGSMTMATRLLSSKSQDYYSIVYAKGAYVFHMIRYLLHDYKTGSDDAFAAFLKDLAQTYKEKIITTSLLQKLLEKHIGADMTWFFDQWVYGTAIPEYKFAYKSERTVDGKYAVVCYVNQKKVPDNFKMLVPITVIFDDDRYIHLKIWVDKPEADIELPLLPFKPKKIIFNTFDAVLCKVDYK
ncbi:MAG: M1 family aminopeptidase [candidate division Zixibacteria bacterium]